MCRKMKKASARTSRAKAYFHGTTLICAQQCRTHLSDPYRGSGGLLVADCSEVAVFRAERGLAANVLSLRNGGMENSFPHRIFCIAYLLCHFSRRLSTGIAEFAGYMGMERQILICVSVMVYASCEAIRRFRAGDFAACERRECAATRGGRTRGIDTYGFHPSCESPPFPLVRPRERA